MFGKILLIVCLIWDSSCASQLIDVACNFDTSKINYHRTGQVYQCSLVNPFIIDRDIQISSVNGTHKPNMTIDDVKGFNAEKGNIFYFPKGIDQIFKNLTLLRIIDCQLKEIHQSDLKTFPNLVFLNLGFNDIRVIENGLFDYNLDLQVIGFDSNYLLYIDSQVFDNLSNLHSLWLDENYCINDSDDFRNYSALFRVIRQAKKLCADVKVLDEIEHNLLT